MKERINIRVTSEEKAMLEAKSFHEGKTLSDYCKSFLLQSHREKITQENILDRLVYIQDLLKNQNDKKLETGLSSDYLSVMIEVLLLLRVKATKAEKDIVKSTLDNAGLAIYNFDTKGQKTK